MEKSKDFEFVVTEDKDLKLGQHKWYGKEDRTEEKSIHDKGKGEQIDIRLEEWKLNPAIETLPTEEQILTPEYLQQLQTKLWADGLRLVMRPRVSIQDGYIRIFAPCQATTSNNFIEEAKLLQEWI